MKEREREIGMKKENRKKKKEIGMQKEIPTGRRHTHTERKKERDRERERERERERMKYAGGLKGNASTRKANDSDLMAYRHPRLFPSLFHALRLLFSFPFITIFPRFFMLLLSSYFLLFVPSALLLLSQSTWTVALWAEE